MDFYNLIFQKSSTDQQGVSQLTRIVYQVPNSAYCSDPVYWIFENLIKSCDRVLQFYFSYQSNNFQINLNAWPQNSILNEIYSIEHVFFYVKTEKSALFRYFVIKINPNFLCPWKPYHQFYPHVKKETKQNKLE